MISEYPDFNKKYRNKETGQIVTVLEITFPRVQFAVEGERWMQNARPDFFLEEYEEVDNGK